MKDSNLRQDGMNPQDLESWRGLKNGALDRQLDAALSKFAAVEPRAGLEARVLANLRIGRERATRHSWWRWPAIAALAAVIAVAVSLVWKSGKSTPVIMAQHPPATTQTNQAGTQSASNGGSSRIPPDAGRPARRSKPPVSGTATVITLAPKLEQFPSPEAMSDQEKMLADYVAHFQEQAVLIARFNEEDLRRDRMELVGNAQQEDE